MTINTQAKNQKHQNSQALGRLAEQRACEFLQAQGYQIIAKNYSVHKVGEIDIIAHKVERTRFGKAFGVLVCAEIKARTMGGFGRAIDTISLAKQKRLINAISHFVQAHTEYQNDSIRFDVIAIDVDKMGECVVSDECWVRGAFLGSS